MCIVCNSSKLGILLYLLGALWYSNVFITFMNMPAPTNKSFLLEKQIELLFFIPPVDPCCLCPLTLQIFDVNVINLHHPLSSCPPDAALCCKQTCLLERLRRQRIMHIYSVICHFLWFSFLSPASGSQLQCEISFLPPEKHLLVYFVLQFGW